MPTKTSDGKVAGVLLATNSQNTHGFSETDLEELQHLADSVAALVRKHAANVIFAQLDENDTEDGQLRGMLSDFGKNRKSVKGLMKRKTRAILMARRLSAGAVPDLNTEDGITVRASNFIEQHKFCCSPTKLDRIWFRY